MSYYGNILEEELKNKVAHDLFGEFDTTQIVGRVDFSVCVPADPLGLNEPEPLLWAEAKRGTTHDIYESFIQLILTLGKERPQDHHLPPAFIGAFDAEKIAFLPYAAILDVLRQNDFNWNVAPSDHNTKEFNQLHALLKDALHKGLEIYDYERDAKELVHFIRHNFTLRKAGVRHIRINKNNFTHIYQKWLDTVKPTIAIDWDSAKRYGLLDADFYLADILSEHNLTLKEKLFVLLRHDHYELDRGKDEFGLFTKKEAWFSDNQKAHTQFWNRYARPPRREYWDYIVDRRDLLVPQDIRERKGSFFTPRRWVELSQQYIAAELGEDWQDEYYVWDCCAGTGNLLDGLTNKYRVWASTLDKADVQVMHDRIQNGYNLLESHVFQFDFLNDPFTKLPQGLQDIINDPEKRKRLVVYINPPYAEASNARTVTGRGENRGGLSDTYVRTKYKQLYGRSVNELFAQFLIRIFEEIPGCTLGVFSKLKVLQGPNFTGFRDKFTARPSCVFCVPAKTFDNVSGEFPIAFQIWNLADKRKFTGINADIYDADGNIFGQKRLLPVRKEEVINQWLHRFFDSEGTNKGTLRFVPNDFQNNSGVYLTEKPNESDIRESRITAITANNLLVVAVYLAVRHCIEATWLNDRDQFLYPNDGWQTDYEFQADCLAFTLLHGQNRISNEHGENHWIPFTEEEVGAKDCFKSHFMSDLLRKPIAIIPSGKNEMEDIFETAPAAADTGKIPTPLEAMSQEAKDVMDAGRELWRYYHAQPDANPDASFYDIRLHFQGTKVTKSGKVQMNTDSTDPEYTRLIRNLREAQKALAAHIEPKVYQYGFLKA